MRAKIYEFVCKTASGASQTLGEYEGKVLLVVNTASKCGFTPQFEGLEELHKKFGAEGFEVLGFPCNQFKKQDPGDIAEIVEFCQLDYGVTFPIFAKVEVNGEGATPLFEYLKKEAPGALGTLSIKWNFTKFLIDSSGRVLKRYAPATKPAAMEADIRQLLSESA